MLFVGADGSSPQIAASLLRQVSHDRIEVDTVGVQPADPGGRSDQMLVAMGLDPAAEHPLNTRSLHTADRVVPSAPVSTWPGSRVRATRSGTSSRATCSPGSKRWATP